MTVLLDIPSESSKVVSYVEHVVRTNVLTGVKRIHGTYSSRCHEDCLLSLYLQRILAALFARAYADEGEADSDPEMKR